MSPQTEPQDQWYVMRDLKRPNARIRAYQQLSESGLVVFTGQLQKPVEMLKNTPSVNSYLGA